MNKLIVAPAPHAHSGDSVRKNMLLVIAALMPAYAVSLVAFGWGALITTLISIVACCAVEWLIAKFILKQQPTLGDCSAILTGLLLAFNLPWWLVVIGAVVAIGVGKMTFGGLGQNPFNPALVGRVFLLIAYPVQMTSWPLPQGFNGSYVDAATGATPLSVMKQIVHGNADLVGQLPELKDAFFGFMGGSLGEVSALALLAGGIFLILTRVITWHIPVSILAVVSLFAWIASPEGFACAHEYILYTLLTGGIMLGAFFMATDYVTSPMTGWGKIIFGVGIGLIVMVIRTWGAYPEGMSFAILIMNATVPLLNKIRPTLFGEKVKR